MITEGWRGDIAECMKNAVDDDGSRQTQKIVSSETKGSTAGDSHKTNFFLGRVEMLLGQESSF